MCNYYCPCVLELQSSMIIKVCFWKDTRIKKMVIDFCLGKENLAVWIF